MQKYVAVGRLTKDPEFTHVNKAKCTFTIAVETRKGNYQRTDFIPCVAWREQAELIANYTVKGQQVAVSGEWRSSTYTKGGQNQTVLELEVHECQFLERPKTN